MPRRFGLLTAAIIALPLGFDASKAAEPAAIPPTYGNRHADPDAAIDSDNVGRMRLAWKVETDAPVSHVPLVQDGRVYVADWHGTVYAVDAQSGDVIWRTKVLEQPKTQWPWHGFAGTGALGEGLLFEASAEGEAFALATETGEVVWRTRIAEDPEAGSISRLTYYDGLVYIGLSSVEEPMTKMKPGFEPNFQGKVIALDGKTGETVWERRLVTPPQNGVAVWSSFALDPATNILYFTTGNNYTGEASPLSDSIVAVGAKTGDILWARQVTQHDVWTPVSPEGPDFDFAAGPQLFEATIDGERRFLVGAGQKSGFFYVWDRLTGEPVWTTSIGYSGVDGGMHGEASIDDGRIFAWSNNNYHHTEPPEKVPLSVKALDAATGRQLWVKDQAQPAALFAAGFLADDVYFVPSLDGRVRAYRASDGKELWTSEAQGPITSSLWVEGDTLYFGTGAPGIFKAWAKKGPSGLFAYRPGQQQG